MAEEFFYAPLADSRPVALQELVAAFVEVGRQATIQRGRTLHYVGFALLNSNRS